MNGELRKEFQYFMDHKDELVGKYRGRFIVIKGEKVVGNYASELEAIAASAKEYELGTFLVQECVPDQEANTFVFHSRVAFA